MNWRKIFMKNYYKINFDAFTKIVESEDINSSNCLALYNFLVATRDEDGNSRASYNDIIKYLKWSRGRISQTIKELENLGVIKYDRPSQLIHKANTFSFPFQEVEL